MYRTMLISITALIVMMLGATGMSAASQTALPGDSLYSVKTSLEDVQLSATGDVAAKARLNMEFAQNRLSEIQTLAETQRYDEIADATANLDDHLSQAAQQVAEVSQTDPTTAATLSEELAVVIAQHAKIIGKLAKTVPASVMTAIQSASTDQSNANDNIIGNDNGDDNGNGNENDNDDNGNDNGNENDNDDNGNDNGNENENDDNGDDNGNDNDDDNGNDTDDDNGNDNDDDNGNDNDDDNGNDNGDDNGNENENENNNDN